MKDVKFSNVNTLDDSDYLFVDDRGEKYHLFNDLRGKEVQNITPDFWDKFYFCKQIKVEYVNKGGKNIINKIVSYK